VTLGRSNAAIVVSKSDSWKQSSPSSFTFSLCTRRSTSFYRISNVLNETEISELQSNMEKVDVKIKIMNINREKGLTVQDFNK
jgi:hypothetical protein